MKELVDYLFSYIYIIEYVALGFFVLSIIRSFLTAIVCYKKTYRWKKIEGLKGVDLFDYVYNGKGRLNIAVEFYACENGKGIAFINMLTGKLFNDLFSGTIRNDLMLILEEIDDELNCGIDIVETYVKQFCNIDKLSLFLRFNIVYAKMFFWGFVYAVTAALTRTNFSMRNEIGYIIFIISSTMMLELIIYELKEAFFRGSMKHISKICKLAQKKSKSTNDEIVISFTETKNVSKSKKIGNFVRDKNIANNIKSLVRHIGKEKKIREIWKEFEPIDVYGNGTIEEEKK